MSAFAVALSALFADPNIGRDAVYIAEGGAAVEGPWDGEEAITLMELP